MELTRVAAAPAEASQDPEILAHENPDLLVRSIGHVEVALIIGGTFDVFRATGAVDAAMGALLRRWGDRPFWLVAGGISLFAVGSATIGFGEEYFPFVPVLITLALTLGYDRVTAVGIVMVGYGVGYGAALINPFTVLLAQDVAGLQPASGL